METHCEVVIIGGGLSGLAAAKLLYDKNVNVVVLEARDRVGGRTHTVKNDVVEWVDLGGSYVGPSQNHILRLAKDLGIKTYKVFSDLASIQCSSGKSYAYTTQWARFGLRSPLGWFDINYVMEKMDRMMESISAEEPWNSPNAQQLDDMSLQAFFAKECWTRHGYEHCLAVSQANLAADPAHVSLLWALWYVKCCDGNRRIWNVDNGAQERKFEGGSMSISEQLAKILRERVHLGSQVCELSQTETGVSVSTTDGDIYKCSYVIMAIPLPMQLKIHYDPPLPPLRNQLIQRTPVGCVIKANVYYLKPFWREKGYNGFIACADGQSVLNNVVDDCRPGFPLAALTVFVIADQAIKLQEKTPEERKYIIVKDLAKAYNDNEALKPVHYEEKNWLAEQYSGGCYVSTFPPGVLSRYGRVIREPFNRVFFAGTETATSWPGYMNGAVQAGERAAREVMYKLRMIKKNEIIVKEPECLEVPALPFEKSFLERHPPSVGTILGFITVSTLTCFGGIAYLVYCMCGEQTVPEPPSMTPFDFFS